MICKVDSNLIDSIQEEMIYPASFTGIKTGFLDFDMNTDGFADDELIVIGGRPCMGKTTFAISLIDNACINDGKSCVFFSLNMSRYKSIEWLIRVHGRIPYNSKDNQDYHSKIKLSADDIRKAHIWINDSCVDDMQLFIDNCRSIGEKERIDFIMIDDMQSLDDGSDYIKPLLLNLKSLAMNMHCPVIILTNIGRNVERRKNHYPRIADLPHARVVEEVADEILFLYREAYYNSHGCRWEAQIILEKHRRKPRLISSIVYDDSISMFRSVNNWCDFDIETDEEDSDWIDMI